MLIYTKLEHKHLRLVVLRRSHKVFSRKDGGPDPDALGRPENSGRLDLDQSHTIINKLESYVNYNL